MRVNLFRTVFVSLFYNYSARLARNRVSKFTPFVELTRNFKMQCGTTMCCGLSKDDLKERLTPQQYQVTQEKDTERPFSGKYCKHKEKGIYTCIVCGQDIFSSQSKYESKCGWPAFFDVVDPSKVKLTPDLSHDMLRTEVSCSKCGAHMGHVFDDGPQPTGKRYCINSASLDFRKATEVDDSTNIA